MSYLLKAPCIFPKSEAKRIKKTSGVTGESFNFSKIYGDNLVAMGLAKEIKKAEKSIADQPDNALARKTEDAEKDANQSISSQNKTPVILKMKAPSNNAN